MCTVSVKVDQAVLRDVLPELDSTAAISRWAQRLIDEHIRALVEDNETMDIEEAREMTHGTIRRKYALERDMTPDQLYNVIAEEIDAIYANG